MGTPTNSPGQFGQGHSGKNGGGINTGCIDGENWSNEWSQGDWSPAPAVEQSNAQQSAEVTSIKQQIASLTLRIDGLQSQDDQIAIAHRANAQQQFKEL